MSYWFEVMSQIGDRKYADQTAYLREDHGFSQAHANALVLYSRGSTSSRRYASFDGFLAPLDEPKQKTVRAIFDSIMAAYPDLELVIAWNQPMVKLNTHYVFGVSVAKNHITIAPMGDGIIEDFNDRLTDYKVNKKTIQVPVDWKIDNNLLRDMTAARLAQITS